MNGHCSDKIAIFINVSMNRKCKIPQSFTNERCRVGEGENVLKSNKLNGTAGAGCDKKVQKINVGNYTDTTDDNTATENSDENTTIATTDDTNRDETIVNNDRPNIEET